MCERGAGDRGERSGGEEDGGVDIRGGLRHPCSLIRLVGSNQIAATEQ